MSPWRRRALSSTIMAICVAGAAAPSRAQSSEAAVVAAEWLGPHPSVVPAPRAHRAIWQGPGAMQLEQQQAQQLIRSWWPAPIADAKAEAIIDGFSRYLQTHAIEREFDQRYLRIAHSVESRWYLGNHIIWSFPVLRLSRDAATSGDRYAAAFAALERWIGIASLQGAMFEVARLPAEQLTGDVIIKTLSNAAGQDLVWLFDAVNTDVSYALTGLTETSVTVARHGTGLFTGRSAARIGEFQSGDAIAIKVVFADAASAFVSWDGRDQSRTFTFQGPSPVVAAYLDPDRIVTLDRSRLDNSIVTPSSTNVPVRKWTARWMVWLQHTILSYGFLA